MNIVDIAAVFVDHLRVPGNIKGSRRLFKSGLSLSGFDILTDEAILESLSGPPTVRIDWVLSSGSGGSGMALCTGVRFEVKSADTGAPKGGTCSLDLV